MRRALTPPSSTGLPFINNKSDTQLAGLTERQCAPRKCARPVRFLN